MSVIPPVRPIQRVFPGTPTSDGAGVQLIRVLGHGNVNDCDPFLMLDAFDSTDPADYAPGFPWHPHRGIETITYLVAGRVEHSDSLGHHGVIESGDTQWMTAGSGIIHQEMPLPSERLLGVQLWVNLPARAKMTAPHYADIRTESIPVVETKAARVRVIAGSFSGTPGAFTPRHAPVTFLDIEFHPQGSLLIPTEHAATVFVYILTGSVTCTPEGAPIMEKHAILCGAGEALSLTAGNGEARCLVFAAPPLREPIAWGGPIVMNSQAELDQAFNELANGSFIREREPSS